MSEFLSGVIEGFYGQPWSQAERFELFDMLRRQGLNAFLYAPKDDLKHRNRWRELYTESEAGALRELIQRCRSSGVRFIYALGPGLDIHYSEASDLDAIRKRFEQLISLGSKDFALLFDDIPDRMHDADAQKFKTFAFAQSQVANEIFHWLRTQIPNARFLFCPTPYCGRMAQRQLGGSDYLEIIGRELLPGIDVFWTGPEIVSQEISVEHIREISAILRRKPLIWDNLHANDYDGRRFYAGPYSGRSRELLFEVSGILTNPNCEFPLNFIPVYTFADFLKNSGIWQPRESYLAALNEWLPKFEIISFDDLVLLCDCFYLPHQDGAEAITLFNSLREVVECAPLAAAFPFLAKATHLRETCARLAEIQNRPLFYALSRRIWELREELDLLEKFIAFRSNPHNASKPFTSDFHLPKTYRGGFVPALQKLLAQNADGSFVPAPRLDCTIRPARVDDLPGAYYVCFKTGNYGQDGEPFYREDPDALGRIFVGPYLRFEPDLSLTLEDSEGICGYAFAAFDSRVFYDRYEKEWRPQLTAKFPMPTGDPSAWTRVQQVHSWYHHPDYFMPEPYSQYPSHMHIDLLPRAQGRGYGRRMMEHLMKKLRDRGSPGAHLGVSALNPSAEAFYRKLGFRELVRAGAGNDAVIYMGKQFK